MNAIQMRSNVSHSPRAKFLITLIICLFIPFSFGCTPNTNNVPSTPLKPTDIPTDVPTMTSVPPTRTPVPPTRTPVPTATPIATEAEINQAVADLIRYYELKMVESALARLPESQSANTLPSDVRALLTREYILLNQALRDGSSLYPISGILNELINASNRAYLRELWTPIVAQNPQIIATMNRTLPTFISLQQQSSGVREVVDDLLTQLPEDRLTLVTRRNPGTFITQVVQNEGDLPSAFRALQASDEFSDTIQVLDDTITSQPNIVRANSPRGPPAIDIARDPQAADLVARYSDTFPSDDPQSSNTAALQQRSDVGGVIIGSLPTDSINFNVVDVSWEIDEQDKTVVFTLEDDKDQEITSIAYDATIAYQALAYAADRRALATTIINGTITLHPVLVDTSLGNDMIALDHFVFDIVNSAERRRGINTADCYLRTYREAWYSRYFLVDVYLQNNREMPTLDLLRFLTIPEDTAWYLDPYPYSWNSWQGCNVRDLEPESPLFNMVEYRDPVIAQVLLDYPVGNSENAFFDYLYGAYGTHIMEASGDELRDWRNELSLIKFFGVEDDADLSSARVPVFSHVTELDYGVDISHLLMIDSSTLEQPVLDFTWQVNFAQANRIPSDPNELSKFLWDYWQFPITQRIPAYVAQNLERQQNLENVIQFTMLQRLFRMVLEERVDSSFPIQRMIELANSLTPYAPEIERTPRLEQRS